jgi:hypothetical protein
MDFIRKELCVGILGLQLAAACSNNGGGGAGESGPDPQESRISIRVEGGQTGGEGGCGVVGPEEPLTFSADDVRALVLGRYETTLAHRPSWQAVDEPSERGKPMVVEVSARGEPASVKSCSRWLIEFPVEVKLSLDEPALDVIIEQTLIAYAADVAELHVDLPAEVAEQMGMSEARTLAPWDGSEKPASLELWFGGDGLHGHARSGVGCGSLVFPEGRTCLHAGSLPLPESDSLRAALTGFDELGPLSVRLPDGSSATLNVSLQGEAKRLCSGAFPAGDARRAEVSVRLTSADERIDVITNGELTFDHAAPLGDSIMPDGWRFSAAGVLPAKAARAMPYFSEIGDDQLVELSFSVGRPDSGPARPFFQVGTFDANATGKKVREPLWLNEGTSKVPSCFDASMAPSASADD